MHLIFVNYIFKSGPFNLIYVSALPTLDKQVKKKRYFFGRKNIPLMGIMIL